MSLAREPSLFPPCLTHGSLGPGRKTSDQGWIRELAVPKRPREKNIPFSLTTVPEGVAHPALQLEKKSPDAIPPLPWRGARPLRFRVTGIYRVVGQSHRDRGERDPQGSDP